MCFFFRMRLRRFLISEPMAGSKLVGPGAKVHISYRRVNEFGGGVTAARGPLESQVEVRNLAPERSRDEDDDDDDEEDDEEGDEVGTSHEPGKQPSPAVSNSEEGGSRGLPPPVGRGPRGR